MVVLYDVDTFGVTSESLKMLRNALAESIHSKVIVVEVPTSDLLCGFFVFDLTRGTAVWTGDGFRSDRAGEGGAGYRSAHAIFCLYGIAPILWEEIPELGEIHGMTDEREIREILHRVAERILNDLRKEKGEECKTLADRNPIYVG